MHSPVSSLAAKRSWQRLDQVEVQQTEFVQWVLICQGRNSVKFGTSSTAELNVFFSITHVSSEIQVEMIPMDDYILYSFLVLRTWCMGFLLRHLREKNSFAMQMVSKNVEDKKLWIWKQTFSKLLGGKKKGFYLPRVLMGPLPARWLTKRFKTNLAYCRDP